MMHGSSSVVPEKFPAGLRVLVVDDDPIWLMILEKMLKKCNYEATVCNRAETGLSLLRKNKNGYDIVLSDVHMPDMDGFKLLEHIGLEMDLPVIMMSADDGREVVMKGVTHGACDYLIKPIRIERLQNIWQHVVRKRKYEWKDMERIANAEDVEQNQKVPEDGDYSSSANEGNNWKNVKKRKDEEEDECEERDESSSKKARVVWSVELHQQFVSAVNQLGIEKAVPKKILELMNVPGLSRENVASHLQKYRLYLRRLNGSQHMGSMYGSFMDSPEVGDRPLSTVNGFDLQTMTSASQLPGRTLATLPAAIVGYSNNIFSFENQKMQYGQNEHHPLAAILQEGYNERYGVDETLDAQSGSMSNTYPRWADHVGLTNGDYDGFGSAVDGFMLQGNNLEENFNTAYNEDFFPVQETAEQHELHQDSIRDELGSLKHAQEAQASKIDELLESQASYKQNLKKVVAQEVSNVVRQEVGNIVALEIAKANRQLLEDIRKPP